MEQNQSTPKSWRDPAKELPEVGQPCLFRYKHGIISGHFAGVDEYKQIIGRTYIWRDQTYIIYGWMPLDEANNWLAQSSAPATVEAERTTAPVSLTDAKIEELAIKHESFGFGQAGKKSKLSIHGFEPEGLREFARALLAAAPAPIQQEPVGYVSQSATSLLMEYRGEGLKTSMRIYSHPEPDREITVPLYAEALAGSQVQAADDARDAARYRWLRDNKHLDAWWSVQGPEDKAENIDADIDEAMREQQT